MNKQPAATDATAATAATAAIAAIAATDATDATAATPEAFAPPCDASWPTARPNPHRTSGHRT